MLEIYDCPQSVVGGKGGNAPCESLLLHKDLFLCQSDFMEVIRLLAKMR